MGHGLKGERMEDLGGGGCQYLRCIVIPARSRLEPLFRQRGPIGMSQGYCSLGLERWICPGWLRGLGSIRCSATLYSCKERWQSIR